MPFRDESQSRRTRSRSTSRHSRATAATRSTSRGDRSAGARGEGQTSPMGARSRSSGGGCHRRRRNHSKSSQRSSYTSGGDSRTHGGGGSGRRKSSRENPHRHHDDTPVITNQGRKGFHLRLSRGDEQHHHELTQEDFNDLKKKKSSSGFSRKIPNIGQSTSLRRGRSSTPKGNRDSPSKENNYNHQGGGGGGLAGKLRSLSKKGPHLLRRTSQGANLGSDGRGRQSKKSGGHYPGRAPSLGPQHEIARDAMTAGGGVPSHKNLSSPPSQSKKKRGRSLPSKIASLRRGRSRVGRSRQAAPLDGENGHSLGEAAAIATGKEQQHQRNSDGLLRGSFASSRNSTKEDNKQAEKELKQQHNRCHPSSGRSLSNGAQNRKSSSRGGLRSSKSRSRSAPRRGDEEHPPPPLRRRSKSGGGGGVRLVGRGTSAKRGTEGGTGSGNRSTARRKSVGGGTRRVNTKSDSREKKDPQCALNDHCREHFRDRTRHSRHQSSRGTAQEQKPDKQHHHHHQREAADPPEKEHVAVRSKSMPPLGTSGGVLLVDRDKMIKDPVSPVASVDSSWRYRRLMQKMRAEERNRKKRENKKEKEQPNRKRSESCKPSLGGRRLERNGDKKGADDKDADNDNGANEGAIVPYVHEDATSPDENLADYNLAYNLGEIGGDFIFGRRSRSPEEGEREREEQSKEGDRNEPQSSQREQVGPLPKRDDTSEPESKDDFTLNDTSEGSGTWRGRAPAPVVSFHSGSQAGSTVVSGGRFWDKLRGKNGLRGRDPPTVATDPRDPPLESNRASSPVSFVELANKKKCKGKHKLSGDGDRGSEGMGVGVNRRGDGTEGSDASPHSAASKGSQEGRPAKQADPANDGNVDDEESVGSLFNDAPSTTGTTERKNVFAAPPLHSTIRSRMPAASVASSRSRGGSVVLTGKDDSRSNRGEVLKSEVPKGSAKEDDAENIEVEEVVNDLLNKGVKMKISEILVDDDRGNDQVSEVTMPPALLRAPPSHARIRAKKPKNRNGLTSSGHKEGRDENYPVAAATALDGSLSAASPGRPGPMTGHEIDIISIAGISEITMPLALHPPFASLLRSYDRMVTPEPPQTVVPVPPPLLLSRPPPQFERRGSAATALTEEALQVQMQTQSPVKRAEFPPPPRRPVPPPPLRHHHSHQHHFRSANDAPAKHHQPTVPTVHENIEEHLSSSTDIFLRNAEQQLQFMRENASFSEDMTGSSPLPKPHLREDNANGMLLHRPKSNGSSTQLSVGETTVLLEDAAAQLLSMQSGASGRRTSMKASPYPEGNTPGVRWFHTQRSSSSGGSSSLDLKQQCVAANNWVENMPYMDEFHDMGLYTGETNEYGQPHGMGQIIYDNGVFFEGRWANGGRDGLFVDTSSERERL